MAINKNHPDFPEFKRKWDDILRRMEEEEEALEKSLPPIKDRIRGHDGPLGPIHKKYNLEFSRLQKEYHYLYEE